MTTIQWNRLHLLLWERHTNKTYISDNLTCMLHLQNKSNSSHNKSLLVCQCPLSPPHTHTPVSPVWVQLWERVCTLTPSGSRSSSSAHGGSDFLFLVHLEFHMSDTPTHTNKHEDTLAHQHKHVPDTVMSVFVTVCLKICNICENWQKKCRQR